MKTVSTLCATAAVTSAASFGCAFAEPETNIYQNSRQVDIAGVATRLNGRVKRDSRAPGTPRLTYLFEPSRTGDFHSHGASTISAIATLDMLSPTSVSSPNTSTNSRAPSRSSSWIKRLSSLSSNISIPGSPRASSPSTINSSTPRRQNKLVKRSSIADVTVSQKRAPMSGITMSRPATSHQRTALRLRSQSMDIQRSLDYRAPPNGWKQFFSFRKVKIAGRTVTRVVTGTSATLVQAQEVPPSNDSAWEETTEHVDFEWDQEWVDGVEPSSSAPASPILPVNNPDEPSGQQSTSPGKSFSIGDLLHSPWSRTRSVRRRQHSQSTTDIARRTSSSQSPHQFTLPLPNSDTHRSPSPLVGTPFFFTNQLESIPDETPNDYAVQPQLSSPPSMLGSPFKPSQDPPRTPPHPTSGLITSQTHTPLASMVPLRPSSIPSTLSTDLPSPVVHSDSFAAVISGIYTNTTNTDSAAIWPFSDSETSIHSDFSPSSIVQSEIPPSSPPPSQCWPNTAGCRKSAPPAHARSQSLPVVQGSSRGAAGKFGTWGVGCTVVSEDWDDDFDFAEDEGDENGGEDSRADSGMAMVVPLAIRAQQSAVRANIGLLREWGLLIEDLKVLRERATASGQSITGDLWAEADAMIELADHEPEEALIPWATPPSSPSVDLDAFEEHSPSPSDMRRRRQPRKSVLQNVDIFSDPASPSPAEYERSARSALGTVSPIFGTPTPVTPARNSPFPSLPFPSFSTAAIPSPSLGPAFNPTIGTVTRPRNNSEALARSVIQALQKRTLDGVSFSPHGATTPKARSDKTTDDSDDAGLDFEAGLAPPSSPSKKVPFDTATLKHIVPYLGRLVNTVRKIVQDNELQDADCGSDWDAWNSGGEESITPMKEKGAAAAPLGLSSPNVDPTSLSVKAVREDGIVSRLGLLSI